METQTLLLRTVMTRIFLLGYMGCGKTTLGKPLAEALKLGFVDLDHYIEGRMCQTVGRLFAERGESAFRELERRLLHEVIEFENVVIATGGGTPCFFDNMELMNERGTTIFLDACPQTLFNRLSVARHKRPLLQNKNDEELRAAIVEGLERRMPFYSRAHHRFESDLLESRRQIAGSVARLVEQLGLSV